LYVDAGAPGRAIVGSFVLVSGDAFGAGLGVLAGIFLAIGAAELLPEAHSETSAGRIWLTIAGVALVFVVSAWPGCNMTSVLGLWIVLALLVVTALYVVYAYNRLVRLRVNVDNAWSQIDVQLRRRYDLIEPRGEREGLRRPRAGGLRRGHAGAEPGAGASGVAIRPTPRTRSPPRCGSCGGGRELRT
jgi:hypothetical protein